MTDILKERRLINLNSEDATFKYNSTFLSNVAFSFPSILKDEKNILYVEGGILNCQIPQSFYGLNYSNNILKYTIFTAPSTYTNFTITIPVGNYNFTTFSTAISAQFLLNGHTMTLTIDKPTGKILFTYTPSSNSLYSFNESGSTCWRILGFSTGSGNILAISNKINPPYLLNLLGVKKIKIFCEAFSVNSYDSKNYQTNSLIDTLSVDVASYGLLNYANITGEYGKLKRKEINLIDIQIKDDTDAFLNFNNTDWSITLALIIYRKIETKNSDLEPLLNTLGNIENILTNIENQQIPQENTENQENTDNQPVPENPPNLDTEDLDLLLYENPNLFN